MNTANHRVSQRRAGSTAASSARGLLVLLIAALEVAAGSPPTAPERQATGRARATTPRKPSAVNAPRRAALPADDWTYRPTVVVRRGTSQGSGTIIASVEGETLVLTAAHVVNEKGSVSVELHRYNLGQEHRQRTPGVWPRVIKAAVAATDAAADVAIVRIDGLTTLPYVARLAPDDEVLPRDSVVNSVGIDLGRKLSLWSTRLVETVSFELNDSREARPFLITEKIPEHGRSGGGLFLPGGELVGVCVGHAELEKGRRRGVFAAGESIRSLLVDHHLNAAVQRSEIRMAGRVPARDPSTHAGAQEPPNSVVTTSRSGRGRLPEPDSP
jgi:S1-C subfamily serine protease